MSPKVQVQPVTSATAFSLSDDRLTRLEEGQSELGERMAAHEASDAAAFNGLKSDLNRIETKVDSVVTAVGQQHELWVQAQTKEEVNKKWNKKIMAILGVVASSGVIRNNFSSFC